MNVITRNGQAVHFFLEEGGKTRCGLESYWRETRSDLTCTTCLGQRASSVDWEATKKEVYDALVFITIRTWVKSRTDWLLRRSVPFESFIDRPHLEYPPSRIRKALDMLCDDSEYPVIKRTPYGGAEYQWIGPKANQIRENLGQYKREQVRLRRERIQEFRKGIQTQKQRINNHLKKLGIDNFLSILAPMSTRNERQQKEVLRGLEKVERILRDAGKPRW